MTELRVLVVDDDFRVSALHAQTVARVPGCVVVGQAQTLAEARELLTAEVHLVVADEYLPDGSGSDLVGASDAAVLLVTAANDAATVRRALSRGVVGYLHKPFDLRLLGERVAAHARLVADLDERSALTQEEIDSALAQLRPRPSAAALPKGRSAVTASAVADLLRDSGEALTANDVADELGVSLATARRYLSDLVDGQDVELLLRYGTAGRPQHRYRWLG